MLHDLNTFVSNAHRVDYTRRLGFTDPTPKAAQSSTRASRQSQSVNSKPSVFAISVTDVECVVCKVKHALKDCKQFRQLAMEKRLDAVKRAKACIRCLEAGHFGKNCESKRPCGLNSCKKLHHALLHGAPRLVSDRDTRANDTNEAVFAGAIARGGSSGTLLPAVPVTLEAKDG